MQEHSSSMMISMAIATIVALNTSICEQFKFFLHIIKLSLKRMSQVRFVFLAQYMIHIWNERKSEAFRSKAIADEKCKE